MQQLHSDCVQKALSDLVQNKEEVTSILDVGFGLVDYCGRLKNAGQMYVCSG